MLNVLNERVISRVPPRSTSPNSTRFRPIRKRFPRMQAPLARSEPCRAASLLPTTATDCRTVAKGNFGGARLPNVVEVLTKALTVDQPHRVSIPNPSRPSLVRPGASPHQRYPSLPGREATRPRVAPPSASQARQRSTVFTKKTGRRQTSAPGSMNLKRRKLPVTT